MTRTTQDGLTDTPLGRRRLLRLAWVLGALGLAAPLLAGCQPGTTDDGDDEDEDEDEDDD